MEISTLTAISPIDGRYHDKTKSLQPIFSEFGLMHYRLQVEIKWFEWLSQQSKFKELPKLPAKTQAFLKDLIKNFSIKEAEAIKKIESQTNHDLKAVEYFLKEQFSDHKTLAPHSEFIHFACTSEDINNLAYALMTTDGLKQIKKTLNNLLTLIQNKSHDFAHIAMLARTHGQPASPTTVGKEFANFADRLKKALQQLKKIKLTGKLNGAVGNFNAHHVAYPKLSWLNISEQFVQSLGLAWNDYTTQIEPHDQLAALFHALIRTNNILIDLCRDNWFYISLNYFTLKTKKKEIGSSTMPHKINPIDFENAEGNLGLSNALCDFMANKLPISRLQRDLSDSTVLRNIGGAFAYSLLAYTSILKGIEKLEVNKKPIQEDLNNHWEVLAEAIQTLMRRYGIPKPYEQLKTLTRGKKLNRSKLKTFIQKLDLPKKEKQRLQKLTPDQYLGYAIELAKKV